MIQIGYYTIGKGMRNKQHPYKILAECKKDGMTLMIGDNQDGRLHYALTRFILSDEGDRSKYDTGIPNQDIPRFNKWEKQTSEEIKTILLLCLQLLSKKYKSLRWIIDKEKLKELIVLDNI